MADFDPELEDGERYLPAGILSGEDGWDVGRDSDDQSRRLLRRQSLFSDRVGGFVCCGPELGSGVLLGASYARVTKAHCQKPRQWLWKGYPRLPVAPKVEGETRVVKRPSQARFLPTAASGAGTVCGGTGFFFPLYRLQSESRRPPSGKGDGDGQKQKLYAAVAKTGMPLQPRTEIGLPQDWNY